MCWESVGPGGKGLAHNYALHVNFPGLVAGLPRMRFGQWPTPLEPLPALTAAAGLPFAVLAKRDDLASTVYGGNEVRKLELILGRLSVHPGLVVTSGDLGSNRVLATAAVAATLGLKTRAFLRRGPVTPQVRRNLLAGAVLGIDMRFIPEPSGHFWAHIRAILEGYTTFGGPPLMVTPGRTSVLSATAYAGAVLEMAGQVRALGEADPAAIVVAAGTGETAAGLLAGTILAGWDTTVVGVRALGAGAPADAAVRALAGRVLRMLAARDPAVAQRLKEAPGGGGRLVMVGEFAAQDDPATTARIGAAVRLAMESQGLRLDEAYTGKAMAALIAAAGAGRPAWAERAALGRPVIFIHTYSAVNPTDPFIEPEPPGLIARLPESLRWCFDPIQPSARLSSGAPAPRA
jgi:L-cysteate sulfo-lyase